MELDRTGSSRANMDATGKDIVELALRAREQHSDRIAVSLRGSSSTYAELFARALRTASALRERGIAEGQRVAALLPNGPDFLELYFAVPMAGGVLVPLNTRLAALELSAILDDCGAEVLVVADEFSAITREAVARADSVRHVIWVGSGHEVPGKSRASLDELAAAGVEDFECARPAARDPAQIYYTSGTTGRAKGVVLTHANVVAHARAVVLELGLGHGDVWGHVAPMFHLADAWACFAITLVGGVHAFLPHFEAGAALALIEEQRVTLTNLVPTMLGRMVHDPRAAQSDLSSLRMILSGGAPIAPELVRKIMHVFACEYVQTYGMTETSPYLTLSLLHAHLRDLPPHEQFTFRAKTGRAFAAVELRVVDEAGAHVARDGLAVGEILARGPTVTPGYWQRPDATAEAFTSDGWLRTGDLATIDAEGYLDIVDRKKDVILTGGETVYSTEVEHRLSEHPEVVECAAFGRPDAEFGERVAAAVVLAPGSEVDPRALRAFCRAGLAGYKVPDPIRLMDELPRTGSGKIAKRLLREQGP